MPMIKLVARKNFKHDGHLIEEGQTISVPSIDARALVARGTAAPAEPERKPKKGQYRRRDMVAEPQLSVPAEDAQLVEQIKYEPEAKS